MVQDKSPIQSRRSRNLHKEISQTVDNTENSNLTHGSSIKNTKRLNLGARESFRDKAIPAAMKEQTLEMQ